MRLTQRIAGATGAVALLAVTAATIAGPVIGNIRPANAAILAPQIPADPPAPQQATPPDFDMLNGHFFSQTGGNPNGEAGFAVTNGAGIPFWDAYRQLGGVQQLGFPVSGRFEWRGSTVQVMQRNILVWDAANREVTVANTFDLLHDLGNDKWLQDTKKVPPPNSTAADEGRPWEEVKENHYKLLVDEAIRERYFQDPLHVEHYGLPMSYAEYDEVFVIRMQRAVFQRWKVDTAFAKAGDVTIANGGDVAKELGLFPREALAPQPSPFERGEASKTPWSGWWWPAHPNGGQPQIWQPGGPLAKYDSYVRSLGRPNPDTVGWEMANMRFFKPDEDWAGHCNGWAAAAILEPEPKEAVTRGGITFSIGDQKGLLSEYHFGDEAAWVVGGKPDGTKPQEMREALNLWLREKNKPFLTNLYSGSTQVWSAPAYKYETIYGPDKERPDRTHFQTKIWFADYRVAPNYVGTQVFGGEPKVYEYWMDGPIDKPTATGWEGISATNSDFARPFHMWYPDPTTRNTLRWTPAFNYQIIKQIVPGAGTAEAEFARTAGSLGFLSNTGSRQAPLLPNSFWMSDRETAED